MICTGGTHFVDGSIGIVIDGAGGVVDCGGHCGGGVSSEAMKWMVWKREE